MDNRTKALCDFLNASHSLYHAQSRIMDELKKAGYTRLFEQDDWELVPGGKYYLVRGGTAVIAFRIPGGKPKGFLMSASHSDRPCFKVKENFELTGNYTRMAVERYGGQLLFTWLDRPLSVAGRVTVETEDGVETKLVDIDKDLLLIPNVAIHMNRQVNDGYKWNPAVDLLPLIGGKETAGKLEALLREQAGGRILGHDLYLYVRQSASVWGVDDEYISSAALDDLECAWGCTQGFLNARESQSVPVLCIFDSEEVGSGSVQGAASMLLPDVLRRVCAVMDWNMDRMLAQSFMVSADNAHAVHPNHPELADPTNAPVMGKGIVLKHNANLSYCTDGVAAAIFRKVCGKAGVSVQSYYNRADIPGGSTLGRISLGKISVPTADIGLPQLAMHSCYETAAAADAIALEEAMAAYYGSTLEAAENGYILK
ncbi:MAG: M18 family aminopeptidase [Oscillospiraceae bacterium]|nr:M18 family aminopeptidase [Oscillospiraceae bacterium]